jgi:hypothetical protein
MTYANYAKIVDPNSEYYGQVFEVSIIGIHEEVIYLKNKAHKFHLSDIQFCVTKDNEPVKIGEEYVCIGDTHSNGKILNWYEWSVTDGNNGLTILSSENGDHMEDEIEDIAYFYPLHPTNKIKITAENIEELQAENFVAHPLLGTENHYDPQEIKLHEIAQKINELIRAFNRLTK